MRMKVPRMRISRKGRNAGAALLALGLVASGWMAAEVAAMERTAGARVFDDAAAVPANRVGLLLGCSPRLADGRRNLYFDLRIRAAAELYRAGKVRYVLASGDNGTKGYDEPGEMKAALVAAGVPEDRIALDYAGFRTLDSVVRAKKVFGEERFTVISQRFHNERAVYLARENGIDAVGFNARDVGGAAGRFTRLREIGARVKAVLDVHVLRTRPRFLGEPVRIGA
jgi:SanA protein